VNPAAGRDIRRLTGGASVSDNYAKRRSAESVLEGLTIVDDPPGALVMPDKAGIGQDAVETAPDGLDAQVLDVSVTGERTDTRRAAERFRDDVDVVVVLGGDGTNRDVAATIGSVPVAAVSTGTNNVVPTPIDGRPPVRPPRWSPQVKLRSTMSPSRTGRSRRPSTRAPGRRRSADSRRSAS